MDLCRERGAYKFADWEGTEPLAFKSLPHIYLCVCVKLKEVARKREGGDEKVKTSAGLSKSELPLGAQSTERSPVRACPRARARRAWSSTTQLGGATPVGAAARVRVPLCVVGGEGSCTRTVCGSSCTRARFPFSLSLSSPFDRQDGSRGLL